VTDSRFPQRAVGQLLTLLDAVTVDAAVFALRPDYRALLIAVDGIEPAPSNEVSDELLGCVEAQAREVLLAQPAEQIPHVAAWRDAYRCFGAKPQRTRNSLEALLRRVDAGLPRVNRLTDTYNAVSVRHHVPLGGEDLNRYVGAPRLVRAAGNETFVTTANAEPVSEHPDAGEVVWCDDEGVTCRRWNWRQTTRTQLRDDTTAAIFILDALGPMTDDALRAAADDLLAHLTNASPAMTSATKLVSARGAHGL
jgi:DNA/RNA-binding domain of Phe-tRNA-synthetase-like protein